MVRTEKLFSFEWNFADLTNPQQGTFLGKQHIAKNEQLLRIPQPREIEIFAHLEIRVVGNSKSFHVNSYFGLFFLRSLTTIK